MMLRGSLLALLAVLVLTAIQRAYTDDTIGLFNVLVLHPLDIMNHKKIPYIGYKEVDMPDGYFKVFGDMSNGSFSHVTDGEHLIWGEERKYAGGVQVIQQGVNVYVRVDVIANAYDTTSIYKQKVGDGYVTIDYKHYMLAYKRALIPLAAKAHGFLPVERHTVNGQTFYYTFWSPKPTHYVVEVQYNRDFFWEMDDESGDLLKYAMTYKMEDATEAYYALVLQTPQGILYAKHYKSTEGKPVPVEAPLPIYKKIRQPYKGERAVFDTKEPFYPPDAKAVTLNHKHSDLRLYLKQTHRSSDLEKINIVLVPELNTKALKVVLEGQTIDLQNNIVYNVYSTGVNDGVVTHFDAYYTGRKTKVFAFEQNPVKVFPLDYFGFHSYMRSISKIIPTADLSECTKGIHKRVQYVKGDLIIHVTVEYGYAVDELTFYGFPVWPSEKLNGKVFHSFIVQVTKGKPEVFIECLDENGIEQVASLNLLPLEKIATFVMKITGSRHGLPPAPTPGSTPPPSRVVSKGSLRSSSTSSNGDDGEEPASPSSTVGCTASDRGLIDSDSDDGDVNLDHQADMAQVTDAEDDGNDNDVDEHKDSNYTSGFTLVSIHTMILAYLFLV